MSVVICDLPRAGLGNQLFILLKGAVFARLNDLPLVIKGYDQFSIGPYLRKEKVKRNYKGYFTFEKNFFARQTGALLSLKYKSFEEIAEPLLNTIPDDRKERKKFTFSELPHWSDFFAGLNEHRALVLSLFQELVQPGIREMVRKRPPPCIGVHIRMGDFRKLKAGEDFSRVGTVRTPEEYFIEIIRSIRSINGSDLPVSVFTDGYRKEFETLFSLENISMVEGNPDIVDLLLLSTSKIIVASAGSTFSYWSGFLSDAPLILHPDHIPRPIRGLDNVPESYEGALDISDPGLIREIKKISPFI